MNGFRRWGDAKGFSQHLACHLSEDRPARERDQPAKQAADGRSGLPY
jgi:hypothetical protein